MAWGSSSSEIDKMAKTMTLKELKPELHDSSRKITSGFFNGLRSSLAEIDAPARIKNEVTANWNAREKALNARFDTLFGNLQENGTARSKIIQANLT